MKVKFDFNFERITNGWCMQNMKWEGIEKKRHNGGAFIVRNRYPVYTSVTEIKNITS